MDAKELRIGNYVFRQSDKMIVNRTSVYQIEVVTKQTQHKYDPIPLTEEWLYKFGGISSFTSDPQERQASKKFVFGEIEIHMYNEDLEEFMFETHFIKTVHQFQNLYFLLIGKDLNVKNEH